MSIDSEKYMPREAIHELDGEEDIAVPEGTREVEHSPEIRDLLQNIDSRLKTQLFFRSKVNEGQQALIFKFETQKIDQTPEVEGQKKVDNYLPQTKSVKVLKVTSEAMAANEFKWHDKAYGLYERMSEEDRSQYAAIPKPILTHSLTIDKELRERLNRQNAELSIDKASIILMDWVEGDDLLTKLFKIYLSDRPGYDDIGTKNMNFSSLLLAVSSDFRSRGLDFTAMDTLEQYKKLLQAITKHNHELLSPKQRAKIAKTIELLHHNKIYHNDLHLRNFIVEDGADGEVYIIDFGRSSNQATAHEDGIDDNFAINLLSQYKLESQRNQEIDREIFSDIKRLLSRNDSDMQAIQHSLKKLSEAELLRFLDIDSGQWRLDSWRIKRLAAGAYALKETDPSRTHLISEFLKTKKKGLQVESAQVIDWLDRQI